MNAPLCTVHLYAHVHIRVVAQHTNANKHTHAQIQLSTMTLAPCLQSNHLFSMSCHQHLLVFTQYSTDIAMHIHSCTIVQWVCSIGADVIKPHACETCLFCLHCVTPVVFTPLRCKIPRCHGCACDLLVRVRGLCAQATTSSRNVTSVRKTVRRVKLTFG